MRAFSQVYENEPLNPSLLSLDELQLLESLDFESLDFESLDFDPDLDPDLEGYILLRPKQKKSECDSLKMRGGKEIERLNPPSWLSLEELELFDLESLDLESLDFEPDFEGYILCVIAYARMQMEMCESSASYPSWLSLDEELLDFESFDFESLDFESLDFEPDLEGYILWIITQSKKKSECDKYRQSHRTQK